ncbi:RE2 [Symbiodinium sp. CCMP2592]|nr:RE2 [Symbiodinium sp. CCMP2592]
MSAHGSPVSQPPNVPLDDDDDDLRDPQVASSSQVPGFPASPLPQAPGPQLADMQAMQTMVMSLAQTAQQTLMMVSQQSAAANKPSPDNSGGFTLANKVLKYPEPFGTENADQDALGWLAWSTSFRNWVTFAEPAYESDLAEVEQRLTEVPHIANMPPVCLERARKLYVILGSVLKGRPLAIHHGIEDRNGFECWRQLTCQFSPRTRSRSLALLSAVMGLPAFTRDRTMCEQLSSFERLIAEYEKASGNALPGDVKLSVVLRAIPKALQSHVRLRMDASTSYEDVKNLVLSYEVSTTNWSAARVQQELGLVSPNKGSVSMEVDQDGSASPDAECHYCHKKGHYKRDCRKYKADLASGKVRAITEDDAATGDQGSPSPKAAAKAAVKRIMFDIRAVPGDAASHSSVRAIRCAVSDKPCQSDPFAVSNEPCQSDPFAVSDEPCQSDPCAVSDEPCQSDPRAVSDEPCQSDLSVGRNDHTSCPAEFDIASSDHDSDWDLSPVSSPMRVAAVSRHSYEQQLEICVDTAADESCLPLDFVCVGSHASGEPPLVDCQGNTIHTKGSRLATLEASGVELKERWVVSPVSQPILATGKLLKQGWRFLDFDDLGMCLTSPCHGARIPVGFSNNTLVCKGVIRSIHEPPPAEVRAIKVRLTGLLDRLIRSTDFFQEIAPGVHATSLTSKHLVDLSLYLPYEGLAYRTTLLKIDGDWVLSELSSSIADLGEDLTTQVADQEVEMIVFGHLEPLAPSDLGFATDVPILDAPAPAPPESSADPVFENFFGEAVQEADVELGGGADAESAGGAAVEAAGGGDARDGALDDAVMQGALADEREAQPDKIVVDDVELSLDSTLSVLRRACQSLGVGKSGSKAVVFRRLCNQLDRLKLIEASRAAEVPNAPVPNVPSAPKEPTPEQRRAHEAVHAPYEPWCQHCVAFKARDDMHKPANADRKFPVISFDYGFSGRSEEDGPHNKLAFLCLHDSESGWREAIPVPGKAGVHDGINVISYLAAEICRLHSMLGYSKVVLQCDPEPTCLKLRNEVRRMRLQLGLQTDVQQSPEESHQSNGGAEVAVQMLRQQCNTLLSMYEAETKLQVATAHALHPWCLRHASWILNRFVLRPGGLTPFEIIHGRPYKGEVIPFGETVMGLVSPGPKGKPRFIQAIMLGKCTPNDEFILCSGAGKLMLARTRLATGFSPALHDCVRDPPWRHPGFVAGSLGRSRAQRKPKVIPAGGDARLVVEDQLGGVSDLLGELAPAASDPESSSQMSEDDPDGHRSGEAAAPDPDSSTAVSLPLQPGAPVEPPAVTASDPLLQSSASSAGPMPVDPVSSVARERPRPAGEEGAPGPEPRRARIAAATVCGVEYHHADEDPDLAFSPADIESINELDGLCSDDEDEEGEQGLVPPDELYRPFSSHEISVRYALLSCDISDAYLTCEQPCPTVVTLHGTTYRLAFMLPGQRDGSAVWFATFAKYLVSEGGVSLWPGCEALFALRNHSGGGLLHVDDLLGSGEYAELQRLAQIIESKYKCTLEWLVREGDSLHFLKRKHTLARQDLLCIQKADKHIMKLVELLQLEPKPTPLPLQTLDLSRSDPLPEDQMSIYRSCIGILMYISADTADMQHSIRMLSQHLACPTEACMKALKHLVRYAKSANWASDHATRRSASAGALYMNGNAIYTASRTQRVVAMSSCESELNALVSFAVYVKQALRFVDGVTPECHAFSDSSSARAVVNKQGLSKLKHVEIRLLWVQQALKDGAFKLHPVGTLDNSSDLMTKALKRERMLYLMYLLNIRDGDAQFNRVGEAQAVARDNNLSLKLAVKAVKAFKGPQQRVHALLQALTFMSLIDANQACMLDSVSHPHVLESALSGCGLILVCAGCFTVLCMSLQGCQAEIADELPEPWVVWFTLIIGLFIGLGFWFVLLGAEPQPQMPCEPDDATTPACDDDASTLSDDIPAEGEPAPTPDVTRASSDEPLSEPTESGDGAGDGNSHPASPIAHDPIVEPENHALAAVPITVVDPPGFPAAVDQLLVYHAPISGRRWHVFRGCWGLSRAAVIAEEELGVLLRRDPGTTMCLICMNRVRNDLRFPMLRITDGADDPHREHPEPEPFQ